MITVTDAEGAVVIVSVAATAATGAVMHAAVIVDAAAAGELLFLCLLM